MDDEKEPDFLEPDSEVRAFAPAATGFRHVHPDSRLSGFAHHLHQTALQYYRLPAAHCAADQFKKLYFPKMCKEEAEKAALNKDPGKYIAH